MTRDQILSLLQDAMPSLRSEYALSSMGLFGSIARGESRVGSDIDILVEFEAGAMVTLYTLARLAQRLTELLGRPVDLVENHAGLAPRSGPRCSGTSVVSPDPWRDRFRVMHDDIGRIVDFIGEASREEFRGDEKTVFAVCYAFVRLGEAVTHIPSEVQAAHPEIEWGSIRHFRNFMIHVYPAVDPGRLFDTAKSDLNALSDRLRALITE